MWPYVYRNQEGSSARITTEGKRSTRQEVDAQPGWISEGQIASRNRKILNRGAMLLPCRAGVAAVTRQAKDSKGAEPGAAIWFVASQNEPSPDLGAIRRSPRDRSLRDTSTRLP